MTQSNPLSSLLFYTHNVAKALKPSIDGELAHAIHETLHFALGRRRSGLYPALGAAGTLVQQTGKKDRHQNLQSKIKKRMSIRSDRDSTRQTKKIDLILAMHGKKIKAR